MSEPLSHKHVAEFFRGTIAKYMTTAEFVVHENTGNEVVIHLDWPLSDQSRRRSREITIRIKPAAVAEFLAASPRERGEMQERFCRIYLRRVDGEYNESDPPYPPFVITIDEHDLGS